MTQVELAEQLRNTAKKLELITAIDASEWGDEKPVDVPDVRVLLEAADALEARIPQEDEVERVALAIGAEIRSWSGGRWDRRCWADTERSVEEGTILAEVDGEIDLEKLARAATAALEGRSGG